MTYSAVYFGIHEAKKARPVGQVAGRRSCGDPGGRAGDGRHDQSAARQRCDGGESVAHSLEREGSAAPVAADRAGSAGPRVQLSVGVSRRRQQVRAVWRTSAAHGQPSRRTTISRYGTDTRDYDQQCAVHAAARTRTSTRSTFATGKRELLLKKHRPGGCASRRPTARKCCTGATTATTGCSISRPARSGTSRRRPAMNFVEHRRTITTPRSAAARAARLDEGRQRRCCSPTAGTCGRCRRRAPDRP